MTIMEMLQQSVVLTILGMGVVMAFLWVMTICISLAGKIINSVSGKKSDAEPEAHNKGGKISPEITAVITAAINQYQKDAGD